MPDSYFETLPSPLLRAWVTCYWSRAGQAQPVGVHILPDGCADVIFDVSGGSEPFAVGTMTRPLTIAAATPEYLGIRFRPGRAAFFFRRSLSEITDLRVPMEDLTAGWASLAERLAYSPPEGRIGLLDRALENMVALTEPERRVDAAVGAILRSRGTAAVDEVAAEANVSRQHLGRLFAHHVGVSPKTFARVTRFRAVFDLARGGYDSWASLAAALGYADQSHLIAEFREYAGSTPVPFFLSRR
jgi:AraC-like DNA-binding protein